MNLGKRKETLDTSPYSFDPEQLSQTPLLEPILKSHTYCCDTHDVATPSTTRAHSLTW